MVGRVGVEPTHPLGTDLQSAAPLRLRRLPIWRCSPKPFCADTHYLVSWLGGLLCFLIHQLEGARLVSSRAGETENILVFVFRTTLTNFSLAIRHS